MTKDKLNIMFITQDDPFYIPHFFQEFIDIFNDSDICIKGVVIQAPLGKKSFSNLVKQMFDFYGVVDFVRLGIKYTIAKILNLVAVKLFKGNFWGIFSLEHLLLKKDWKIIYVTNVNSNKFIDMVEEQNIDLLVSVAASQKLKSEILSKPKYGCINIHNAKLPKNRGMLPNFWSLYNYDTEPISAMTVHKMNEKLDEGPIILQKEFSLNPQESLDELIIKTKRANAHLILEVIQMYKQGEPNYLSNDSKAATYNSFPTKEDVRKFRAKGLKLL